MNGLRSCGILLLMFATSSSVFSQTDLRIEVSSVLEGDEDWDWTQVRTTSVPVETPHWLTTMSRTAKVGAHGYHDVFLSISKDGGRTWSKPNGIPSLQRTRKPDGYEVVAGDLWPKWHAATRKVLITGKTFNFAGGTKEEFLREKVSYVVIDPASGQCGLSFSQK